MEEPGHQAAHQVALPPAQHQDQHRAPMVHTTRMTAPTLPLQQPNPPKRNPQCTREESHPFQVPQGRTLDLWGVTSPAALQGRAHITSMARAMGRERRVSTRTRGGQVHTRTAPPTRAKWQGVLEVAKTTVMKVSYGNVQVNSRVLLLYDFLFPHDERFHLCFF